MIHARLLGTGSHLPDDVVTNDDLATRFGIDTTDDWIRRRTGIASRRFAAPGLSTVDLALPAARAALEAAGMDAADLDLIVFATLSPDMVFPGSGVLLQRALGLPDAGRFVPALDVRNQCSGFLYGLSHATAVIRAGMARHVLLVGAELHSAALDLTTRGRAVASLFGDGAGAVVLGPAERPGVVDVLLGADGRYAEALAQPIWDLRQRPFVALDADGAGRIPPERLWAHMDGPVVFRHAVTRLCAALTELSARTGVALTDLDLILLHQANARINQAAAEQLGLDPARVPSNIHRTGNTTAATLPILLDEAARAGRLTPGARVALAAFGSGFTWGAALLEL